MTSGHDGSDTPKIRTRTHQLAEYFYVLSEPERVAIIETIVEYEEVSVETLADHVASEINRSDRATNLALRHVHLPKLADSDIVDYDAEQSIISSTERAREVASVAEAASEIVG